MYRKICRTLSHSVFVLGNMVVMGLVELVALNRFRRQR